MLIDAGAQEDWQDADGNTCKNFPHGQMTEYMKKLNEARQKEFEEHRKRMEEQEVSIDEDEDDDDEEEGDDNDGDESDD
eukprot:379895-Hanusia_phi.AAC.7